MAKTTTTTEQFNPNFKIPDTTTKEPETAVTQNIAFEMYKLRINLIKWGLGTFCIALITMAVNYSFNDRAIGMSELSAYEKYTTEVMVLNENPQKKRMLAQFFGTAAPSNHYREIWSKYYDKVNEEYLAYREENKQLKKEYKRLINLDTVTNADKFEMEYIKDRLDLNKKQEYASVVTPSKDLYGNTPTEITNANKQLAIGYEKEGFTGLIEKDYQKAIKNFENSYQIYPTLHNVEEIYKLLIEKKPNTPESWKAVHTTILDKHPWGMPKGVKEEMEHSVKQ